MREIKFRGRTIDGNRLYGDLVRNEDGRIAIVPPLKGDDNDFHQWEVEPETLGQYTGLKDKNGNEIYEGDVLSNGSPQTMIVVYDNSRAGFMGRTEYITHCQTTRLWLLTESKRDWRVIGNIHDNPDLLK